MFEVTSSCTNNQIVKNDSISNSINNNPGNFLNNGTSDELMVIADQVMLNENGKRPALDLENQSTITPNPLDIAEPKVKAKSNRRKFKKVKVAKSPIYRDGVQPAQILNEMHQNLEFSFEVDTTVISKVRYICSVTVKLEDGREINFTGDGLSKKDAKKKCCHLVLINLYGDTYKPPQEVLDSYNQDKLDSSSSKVPDSKDKIFDDLKKRIAKLCNKNTIQFKSPMQLLHEISIKIAETGKCVSENGALPEQKYTFQFTNAFADPSSTSTDSSDYVAYGFGKSKKEAKNHAAKQALKQFLDCDLDKISAQTIPTD